VTEIAVQTKAPGINIVLYILTYSYVSELPVNYKIQGYSDLLEKNGYFMHNFT